VRQQEVAYDLMAVVIDRSTERRVHLSLILDSLDVNYLRVRDADELGPVIDEIGRPIVLILGADRDQSHHEIILNSPEFREKRLHIIVVGAAAEIAPETIREKVSVFIDGQGTQQEIQSAIELAEQELPKTLSADKSPDFSWKIAGECKQIKEIREQISMVASTDVSVLVGGESGTGKELAAKAIHELSNRSSGPFVAVNCGAIPKELIESELFGHEKGSFSGATSQRIGKFESAVGGTLFLDEVGDMPLDMQVKLLRVLQERCIERVGGSKSIPVDIRIVAATHKNLVACVVDGSFREDLYYRLNVFPIDMPSLCQRRDDIPQISRTLIKELGALHGQPIRLTRAAQQALSNQVWPGNIRELRNLLERLHVLYPGKEVDRSDLPVDYQGRKKPLKEESDAPDLASIQSVEVNDQPAPNVRNIQNQNSRGQRSKLAEAESPREEVEELLEGFGEVGMPVDLKQRVREIERAYLEEALSQSDGVVSKAAGLLGMQRTTLVEKMKKLDVARPGSSAF